MTSALLIEAVSKHYASHTAVRDLSLVVPYGCIYGILGPNGAGKSTTLRMVMNIIARDTGRIEVLGRPPEGENALRHVGYLPEERGLYRRMPVLELLVFFGRLKGMTRDIARQAAREWLERMGLEQWANARVDTLSKGMQQKVQFITTVMHRPTLLILDEPHSGLDPVNQEVLRETMLLTREAGGTVVLSTHNMDQAEVLCDEVCIIAGGRKVVEGGIQELKRRYRGDRYQLVVDTLNSPPEALHALDRIVADVPGPNGRGTTPGSWLLHLEADQVRRLLARLGGLAVEVQRFERIEPTLHEMFLEQVGSTARTPAREVVRA